MKFSTEGSREIDKNGDGERASLRRCSQPLFQDTIRSRVILFVDDDPLIQRSRRIIFEALGYSILTAISGEEALAALCNNVVDAVVLDYAVSGMSGEEIARRIRVANERIPIVLCSSHPAIPASVSKVVDAVVDKARVHALLALIEELVESHPKVTLLTQHSAA